MFQFVLGDEEFGGRIETVDNGSEDGRADPSTGKDISGELLELPAKLLKDAVGVNNLGETLCLFRLF